METTEYTRPLSAKATVLTAATDKRKRHGSKVIILLLATMTATTNKETFDFLLQSLNLFVEQFELIKPFYLDDYLTALATLQNSQEQLENLSADNSAKQLEEVYVQLMTVRKKLPSIQKQFDELMEALNVDALKKDLKNMGAAIAEILLFNRHHQQQQDPKHVKFLL